MDRKGRLICLAVAVAALLVPATYALSGSTGDPHLPDLRTQPPRDARLDLEDGSRLLLFTNAIWNAGEGPLEVRPEHDTESGRTTAFQAIFTHDEDGTWTMVEEREAGSFEFHEAHDHWHFSHLADYSLRRVARDGSPTDDVVAGSDKIGFCMFDEFPGDLTLEHASVEEHYIGRDCDDRNFVQGYSVGWGDTYKYTFAGQFIDISDVEHGTYFLHSEADPSNLLAETNDGNNSAGVFVRLSSDAVRIVTRTRMRLCSPCGRTSLRSGRRFEIRGRTVPTDQGQVVRFSYRKRGGEWRPFGDRSRDAFVLLSSDDVLPGDDGTWSARARAVRAGKWQIRASVARTDELTASAAKLRVVTRSNG